MFYLFSVAFDIKTKYKNYSISIHDVNMINKNINDIKNINNKSKYYNLLADKAYKTQEKYKYYNSW